MKRYVMLLALAASFLTAFQIVPASAEIRITNDRGGAVNAYIHKYRALAAKGERIVVDGPCLSSCTLFTGIVPRDHVCVTSRAELGFHAASYYNDASRSFEPTEEGTRVVMRIYPAAIRAYIERHGGLTPELMVMRGADLAALYPSCR
ncbi:MAG TPA: hypothetical protein VH206_19295 [Xanthobacteraceae bacterium]|jgi:hypothetical protein|nr:hypothetical protein [Xanthobacteraceae bacterium]